MESVPTEPPIGEKLETKDTIVETKPSDAAEKEVKDTDQKQDESKQAEMKPDETPEKEESKTTQENVESEAKPDMNSAVVSETATTDEPTLPAPEVTPVSEDLEGDVPSTEIPAVDTTTEVSKEENSEVLTETQEPVVQEEAATTPSGKRGRGRPRKHPKKEVDPNTPKRGRGRPRKHPRVEGDDGKPKTPTLLPNGQKRGRGRPRKHPYVEKKPLPEGTPKRGRGRPRKYPKKEIDPNSPKRPRGRPRKNTLIQPVNEKNVEVKADATPSASPEQSLPTPVVQTIVSKALGTVV